MILFQDRLPAVELTVKLPCLGCFWGLLAHICILIFVGFPPAEGWDPVSIQADALALNSFFLTLPLFFVGYRPWDTEL